MRMNALSTPPVFSQLRSEFALHLASAPWPSPSRHEQPQQPYKPLPPATRTASMSHASQAPASCPPGTSQLLQLRLRGMIINAAGK